MTDLERNQVIEEAARVADSFREFPVARPLCFEIGAKIRELKIGPTFCGLPNE